MEEKGLLMQTCETGLVETVKTEAHRNHGSRLPHVTIFLLRFLL